MFSEILLCEMCAYVGIPIQQSQLSEPGISQNYSTKRSTDMSAESSETTQDVNSCVWPLTKIYSMFLQSTNWQ